MVLGIILIALSLGLLAYGVAKKNKKLIAVALVALVLIAMFGLGYMYLYSKTPY